MLKFAREPHVAPGIGDQPIVTSVEFALRMAPSKTLRFVSTPFGSLSPLLSPISTIYISLVPFTASDFDVVCSAFGAPKCQPAGGTQGRPAAIETKLATTSSQSSHPRDCGCYERFITPSLSFPPLTSRERTWSSVWGLQEPLCPHGVALANTRDARKVHFC